MKTEKIFSVKCMYRVEEFLNKTVVRLSVWLSTVSMCFTITSKMWNSCTVVTDLTFQNQKLRYSNIWVSFWIPNSNLGLMLGKCLGLYKLILTAFANLYHVINTFRCECCYVFCSCCLILHVCAFFFFFNIALLFVHLFKRFIGLLHWQF